LAGSDHCPITFSEVLALPIRVVWQAEALMEARERMARASAAIARSDRDARDALAKMRG